MNPVFYDGLIKMYRMCKRVKYDDRVWV